MDKIIDHLFVFRGHGIIDNFPGNYTDFRVYEDSKPPLSQEKLKDEKKQKAHSDAGTKLSFNEQKELKNLESKLKSLEYDKKQLESKFEDVNLEMETIQKLSEELQKLMETIEKKEMRWMELIEKFE